MKPNGMIELMLAGDTFHNAYGKISVKPDQLSEGIDTFNALPENERRLPIKYGKHDQGTDAAGWIKGLVGVPFGLPEKVLAIVEWNDAGAKAVKEKRQLYISPEFHPQWVNNKTGRRGFQFLGAALLNDPHLTMLGPAVAFTHGEPLNGPAIELALQTSNELLDKPIKPRVVSETNGAMPMEMREKLCTMLGLESTATDDDILKSLAAMQDKVAEAAEIGVKLSAAVEPKQAEIVALTAQIEESKTKLSELEVQLSAANETIAKQASEKLDAEAVAAFDQLCADGKALPRERDVCLSAYKKDPEWTKAQWELRGKVIELTAVTGVSDPRGATKEERQLAAYDKAIAEGKRPEEAHQLSITTN